MAHYHPHFGWIISPDEVADINMDALRRLVTEARDVPRRPFAPGGPTPAPGGPT